MSQPTYPWKESNSTSLGWQVMLIQDVEHVPKIGFSTLSLGWAQLRKQSMGGLVVV